jgi:hypothetical protein
VLDPAAVGLPDQGHLALGLVGSRALVSGSSSLSITVYENGTLLLSQDFASLTAATSYFSDHLLDLGEWAGPLAISGDSNIDLTVSMSMTASAVASFGFDFVVGDPPANNVPEPPILGLLGLGGLIMRRFKRGLAKTFL